MDRYKSANRASILGMIGNIFLLVIKTIVGVLTHSQSMISDAVNSAGDIYSSLMTFIGNHLAKKKPDDDHVYGHGKAEYLFTMFISISIIAVSLIVLINSTKSLFISYDYNYSIYLVLVCVATITIKFLLYLYTHKIAKKFNNILIEANAKDHISDCIITSVNLLACILGKYGVTYIDGIVGMLVAIWIIIQGIGLFIDSFDVLMDKGMSTEEISKIESIIKENKRIKKFNHLNTTPIGYQYQISVTIFVDGNLSTFESHKIANELEKKLMELDEVYLAIIHVNPL